MNMKTNVNLLLVEDSPTDVLLTRDVVDGYPGFRMRHVERLSDAIKATREEGFDVVLLDLGLPDSQGLATLVELVQASPDVPIVVMTARDDEDLALQAVNAGAQDYLVKGKVVNGVLGRAIRYAIERRFAERSRLERMALASLTADVGLAFIRGGTLHEMLQRSTESMSRYLESPFARIWTISQTENVLRLQAMTGNPATVSDSPSPARFGFEALGGFAEKRISANRKPYVTNDVIEDEQLANCKWARDEGIVGFAGYPLMVDDRVVGVLELFARKAFTKTVIDALAVVANQIALGIDRKLQEVALEVNEERFRELTEHIGQVLWMMDVQENKILYVSPAYEQMWGRSCQSLIDNPQSYMEGIHPLDEEMMRQENAAMFRTGHIDAECRLLRPDGSIRWAWVRGYPVTKESRVVRVVGVIEDITDKRSLAAERNSLLSRLQLYIERMPLAYVLFDIDFRIVDWNSTAERIFGFSKSEMIGTLPPYAKYVPRAFWKEAEEIRARIRAGDMEAHSINENLTKDGRTIVCEWFNTPLIDADCQFAGLLCLARDVTAQKSMEAQFHQAQKMEAIGQLAGGIAHDFNNLLTIILGYCEILLDAIPHDDKSRGPLAAINDAGERAASLTRQLLAFSRKAVLEPKIIDLNEVVRETEKLLRRLIGEDIMLTFVLDKRLSKIKIDPGQLGQVLMNLAVNARDAMPTGGKLTVETRPLELNQDYSPVHNEVPPGRYVLLSVTDTGCGMPSDVKARVFEPFFTTKGVGKGTGLGLSVVLGIIKQSGGHVKVDSEPGKGTSFKLYLPAIEGAQTAHKTPGMAKSILGTETVLLVEDDNNVRGLATAVLRNKGFRVLAAISGHDAIELVADFEGKIHLLMTDVVLPGMSGPDLAAALRLNFPDLKVLFSSGYTDDAVLRHGLLKEKAAFLQKPYSPIALLGKVRQVLDEASH